MVAASGEHRRGRGGVLMKVQLDFGRAMSLVGLLRVEAVGASVFASAL